MTLSRKLQAYSKCSKSWFQTWYAVHVLFVERQKNVDYFTRDPGYEEETVDCLARHFYHWEEIEYSQETSYYGRDMSVFLERPDLMDPGFNHVKIFTIHHSSPREYGSNGAGDEGFQFNTKAINSYTFSLSLVNPQTMPLLEDLILDMLLSRRVDQAHKGLGRMLGTFKNKSNLNLVVNFDTTVCLGYKLMGCCHLWWILQCPKCFVMKNRFHS